MRLGDAPAIRLVPDTWETPAPLEAFTAARSVTGDVLDVARDIAAKQGADHVVIIEPHVFPAASAEAVEPDAALLAHALCLAYPARSAVTGGHLECGVRLVPAALLKDAEGLPDPALVVPQTIGVLTANETPQIAFATAHRLAKGARRPASGTPALTNRLALSASLGADAQNGDWWILGALSGLLGHGSVRQDWALHQGLLADPRTIPGRIRALARQVRLETDLPVQALDGNQSRALRRLLPHLPPADMWQRFILACDDLGTEGKALAARYRGAASRVWPLEF